MFRVQTKAKLYDGKSSLARDVLLSIVSNQELIVEHKSYTPEHFRVSVPPGGGAIYVYLSDGICLEIPAGSLNESQRKILSGSGAIIRKFEMNYRWITTVVLSAIIVLSLTYIFVLPLSARLVAKLIPHKVQKVIGENALAVLDSLYLDTSKLSARKQKLLRATTLDFLASGNIELLWRDGGAMGANAFALLPNYIVVTDQLVKKLSESEVMAVVAHELGHLKLNHSATMLVRSSFFTILTITIFGADINSLGAIPIAIMQANYSQEDETAADKFAIDFLKRKKISPLELANALEKLSGGHDDPEFASYFSSHPMTKDRIKMIKAGI